ncbi:hypothetical protein BDR26DRAFT_865163 [Obelidium mucronatum]|nr:hypothetical protein BDR26DRAFT_865163 [Obelidium mucronatum]
MAQTNHHHPSLLELKLQGQTFNPILQNTLGVDPNLLAARISTLNKEVGPKFPKLTVVQVLVTFTPVLVAGIYCYIQYTSSLNAPPPSVTENVPQCIFYDNTMQGSYYTAPCLPESQSQAFKNMQNAAIVAAVTMSLISFGFWRLSIWKQRAGEVVLRRVLEEFNACDGVVGLCWSCEAKTELIGSKRGRGPIRYYVYLRASGEQVPPQTLFASANTIEADNSKGCVALNVSS